MVASLTRLFGIGHLNLAEDVVQDTLCHALLVWPVQGLPDNPSAWLMRVARNRAIDLIRRDNRLRFFTPELTHLLDMREEDADRLGESARQIEDDQLRMMFACCHPGLSPEVQVTLILKTLCGFSVAEIGSALFATPDSIEKRLGRARKLFRESVDPVELTGSIDVQARIDSVCQAVYLLFNEGYHGSQSEQTVRQELCYEAIRLALLLSEHPLSAGPQISALVALLCFHAARLDGRIADDGSLIQLSMQDRSRWDPELLSRGFHYLAQAASGDQLTEYHLEAAIASVHASSPSYRETKWPRILELYDLLYRVKPSPIVALNRAVAAGHAHGPDHGLGELARIPDVARLKDYPFLSAAQGEFHLQAGRASEAAEHFARAAKQARTLVESEFFERRIQAARSGTG